jgi:hypothetical protein
MNISADNLIWEGTFSLPHQSNPAGFSVGVGGVGVGGVGVGVLRFRW